MHFGKAVQHVHVTMYILKSV